MRRRDVLAHPFRAAQDPRTKMRVEAKLWRPWWRRRFAAFGDGSQLVRPRWLEGTHHIHIGSGVQIYPGAWLAVEAPARHTAEPALVIGDRCLVREGGVLSASERVVLESDVVLAGHVTVIDSDHTWQDGDARIVNNASVTGPIRVGRGTWIAEQSVVLRNTDIGAFCIVAANSVVRGSFPNFSLIAGSPAVVVGSTRERVPEALRALVEPDEGRSS